MAEEEENFRKAIYSYCNNNIGRRILFPTFKNLWSFPRQQIIPKDLAEVTSKIVNELVRQNIIVEIPKPENFEVVYGMYEILPHEKLINE